jgi:hypothetical protein
MPGLAIRRLLSSQTCQAAASSCSKRPQWQIKNSKCPPVMSAAHWHLQLEVARVPIANLKVAGGFQLATDSEVQVYQYRNPGSSSSSRNRAPGPPAGSCLPSRLPAFNLGFVTTDGRRPELQHRDRDPAFKLRGGRQEAGPCQWPRGVYKYIATIPHCQWYHPASVHASAWAVSVRKTPGPRVPRLNEVTNPVQMARKARGRGPGSCPRPQRMPAARPGAPAAQGRFDSVSQQGSVRVRGCRADSQFT